MTGPSRVSVVSMIVTQGAAVAVGLAVAFGMELTADQTAAIMTAAGFVGLIVTLILWVSTVPRERVLEYLTGDDVVAGPANDQVPTGATVRTLPRRAQEAP